MCVNLSRKIEYMQSNQRTFSTVMNVRVQKIALTEKLFLILKIKGVPNVKNGFVCWYTI